MERLCNILYVSGLQIILCSGRSEEHRDETVNWMGKQGASYHGRILRKDHDRRSDTLVKHQIREQIDKSKILFVVEGLFCLQCAPGEF